MPENAESVRRSIELVNRGEFDAWMDTIDPEVVFEPHRAAIQGAYRGHAGVREWIADTRDSFALFQLEIEELRELGDGRVLAIASLRMQGKGSGIVTEVAVGAVFELRDGLIVGYKDYGDHRLAREAAGLAE